MAEILFYRVAGAPLEAVLPDLLEKSLLRGWRVLVRAGTEAGVSFLDEMLWTWRDDAFLPHGTAAGGAAARQPILITAGREDANRADVLMLTLGARAEVDEMARFRRTCLVFDAEDAAAVDAARADWRAVSAAGLPAKYWAREDGRWAQKATNG